MAKAEKGTQTFDQIDLQDLQLQEIPEHEDTSSEFTPLEVVMTFSGMPISVNALYTVFRGRQVLTAAGRRFKNSLSGQLSASFMKLAFRSGLPDLASPDVAISMSYVFCMPDLVNKTWPASKRKYRKIDCSNLVKGIEDCIFSGLGVDDSQVLSLSVRKEYREEPITVVRLRVYRDD